MPHPSALIFGAGGHARVVASIIRPHVAGIEFVTTDGGPGLLKENQVYEEFSKYAKHHCYLAIGDNAARRRIFENLVARDANLPNCIAAQTFIAPDAQLGRGVVICPGAVVMTKAVLGDNTIVNTLSSVDHDCRVGDHTQLAVSVNLAGATNVGDSCFFGIKSATFPGVSIGDNSVVRGGSLVIKDVPADVTVGGNPAQLIRKNA